MTIPAKPDDLLVDDGADRVGLTATSRQVGLGQCSDVVHVEQFDPLELRRCRIDVTRHAHVDHQELIRARPAVAASNCSAAMTGSVASVAAEDDVDRGELGVESVEPHAAHLDAVVLLAQRGGQRRRTVDACGSR